MFSRVFGESGILELETKDSAANKLDKNSSDKTNFRTLLILVTRIN